MEDSKLVSRCLNGDELACKALFDQYSSPMLSLCSRYFKNKADAEDSLQDGFIKIFQNLQNWNGSGNLGGWIRRIIINTCLSKINSNYHQFTVLPNDNFPETPINAIAIDKMSYDEIVILIQAMPNGYRTVFNLAILDGYSYKEIAEMLHINESSCRSQLFKAKNYLANKISNVYPDLKYSL